MNNPPLSAGSVARSVVAQLVVASLLLQTVTPATAAVTDISTVPLGTFNAEPPRANLMFILDNSTSMERDFLPEVNSAAVYTGKCFGYHGLNKIFYNPYQEYVLPPQPNFAVDGNYPMPDYTKVPKDGFVTGGDTVNLKTTVPSWPSGNNNGTPKNYYTTYNGKDTPTSCTQNQYTEVTTWPLPQISTALDKNKAVIDQSKNYAIWYAFYRTRILAMRSAVGRVLAGIDATKFRVGYSTIIETGTTANGGFHPVADFDAMSADTATKSNRTRILEKLYAARTSPVGGGTHFTPLRPALAKAGRYFARTDLGAANPIQYSCQRNYSILTTDGYWNTASEPANYKGTTIAGTAFAADTGDSAMGAPYADKYSYTLADIAAYYYATDLRSDLDNNVTATATDPAEHQHMTTFTLGLGVNGELKYTPNYTDADLTAALGTTGWPDPLTTTNKGNADTGNSVKARIDDLWHAAVNGRGRYYSASSPADVVDSLTKAISQIASDVGLGAAATASSISPTAGDDQFFVPGYQHDKNTPWEGSLKAYRLTFDDDDNIVTPDLTKPEWTAQTLLNARAHTGRSIKFSKGGVLTEFLYDNLTTAQKAQFDNRCATNTSANAKLSQCDSATTDAKAKFTGTNLVNYLRGDSTYYLSNTAKDNALFRTRKSLLGDIINSSPISVGKPPFEYTDAGYADFVAAKKDRQRMVYVGANDGMLHAFRAVAGAAGEEAGSEAWAYIPSALLPKLWKLADANYDGYHQAYVDATPTLADVKFADGTWRTVLVGGLGAGEKMYYALDVTDPASPTLLWEFGDNVNVTGDANLGLSFGNPVVTKLMGDNATWYAVFTSGYNNHTTGDGKGYLYVLNVETGVVKHIIKTDDVGTTSVPSNLGKINSWIHADTDNTSRRIYGGDMLGRMWRFDGLQTDTPVVTLLGSARDTAGKKQPITTRPVITALETNRNSNDGSYVSFGTGKYLDPKDLTAEAATSDFSNQQSIYLVKDEATAAPKGNLRELLDDVTPGTAKGTFEETYRVAPGYYVDLPATGERVSIDGQQFNGLVSFASGIPQITEDVCLSGGTSSLYFFDLRQSKFWKESIDTLVVGGTRVFKKPGDGSDGGSIIWTTNKNTHNTRVEGVGGGVGGTKLRRSSWREIVD